MEFLSSAMLWGVLAASLPVLIHLAGRAKPVVHRFPAMRFLLRSHRSSSRALRIKHVMLLLLRAAILALLAFAFARPLFPWRSAAAKGALIGDVVLVVDASLSMQYRTLENTRFEAARDAALAVLDRLADEARVALIRAGDDAELVQGRLTLDHESVRERVREMSVTAQALDVGRSLDAARRILERDEAGRPQTVIFVTDLQASGYERLAKRVASGETHRMPALILVDVGDSDARNGAVLSLRLPGATVPSDESVRLNARIRPPNPQRGCPVDLYLDGLKVGQQTVAPREASEVDVQFTFPAGPPGVHSGWLQLAHNDGLMADQRRYFTYRAGRPPRVLLVQRRDGTQDRGGGFFLNAVLSSPAAAAATGLAPGLCDAGNLNGETLAQQRCVVLADCGALTEKQWRELSTFVEEGGGLFVWLGPRTDPASARKYAFSDVARYHGLLPGKIEERVVLKDPAPVRLEAPDHPMLARFPVSVSGLFQDLRVRSYTRIFPDPRDKSLSVLLTVGEKDPLLLEKMFGRGRVLLAAVGPADEDSDLVKHGEVFLTLVLEACRLLSQQEAELAFEVGRNVTRTIQEPPADGVVFWFRPEAKEPVSLQLEAPLDADPAKPPLRNRLITPHLEDPGLHRFTWKGKSGVARELLFAVNVSAREADLTRLEMASVTKVLAPWPVTVVRDVDEAPLVQRQSAGHREFSALLLLLVLALMLAEAFLSNRMYRQAEPDYEAPPLPESDLRAP